MKASTWILGGALSALLMSGSAWARGDAALERGLARPHYGHQDHRGGYGHGKAGNHGDRGYRHHGGHGYGKVDGHGYAKHGRGHDDEYYDYARVVRVEPIYRTVRVSTPQQYCWDERAPRYDRRRAQSYTPVVLGGILGGVVGNQLGKGDGKDLMTVGGVLLGASLGYDASRHAHQEAYGARTRTICEVRHDYHEEARIDGYLVTYVYRGETFTRTMDHDPGPRLSVKVTVTPVGDGGHGWRVEPYRK